MEGQRGGGADAAEAGDGDGAEVDAGRLDGGRGVGRGRGHARALGRREGLRAGEAALERVGALQRREDQEGPGVLSAPVAARRRRMRSGRALILPSVLC